MGVRGPPRAINALRPPNPPSPHPPLITTHVPEDVLDFQVLTLTSLYLWESPTDPDFGPHTPLLQVADRRPRVADRRLQVADRRHSAEQQQL